MTGDCGLSTDDRKTIVPEVLELSAALAHLQTAPDEARLKHDDKARRPTSASLMALGAVCCSCALPASFA